MNEIFFSLSFLSFPQYLKAFNFNMISEWYNPCLIALPLSSVNQELYFIFISFLSNWSSIALYPHSHKFRCCSVLAIVSIAVLHLPLEICVCDHILNIRPLFNFLGGVGLYSKSNERNLCPRSEEY